MKKPNYLLFASFIAVALLGMSTIHEDRPQDRSPNFIVILTDDQSWVGTSFLANPEDPRSKSDYYQTPNMERLARMGMRFTNGYAPAPYCSPTRKSILIGQTPARHEYQRDRENWTTAFRRQLSIPQMLKKANPDYQTAHFGKWDFRYDGVTPEEMGYDRSDGLTRNDTGGGKNNIDWPTTLDDPKLIFSLTERAGQFMEEQVKANNPFLVQVSHYAVHLGITYTEQSFEKYEHITPGEKHHIPEFAAMTEDLDTGIGLLLDKVEKLGLTDNTYLIFLSDNGGRNTQPIGGKQKVHRNYPLRDGKGSMYEGGLRVPFVVAGPGIKKNSYSHVPVTGMDILPTLADLAGYPEQLPEVVDGGSLRNVLHSNGTKEVIRNRPFLVFHHAADRSPESAIREGNYKLVKTWEKNKLELFDLAVDVGETNDLSEKMPKKVHALDEKLTAFLEQVDAETKRTGKASTEFRKGKTLYSNQLQNAEDVQDWKMEGPGKIEFEKGWMHMYAPEEAGHHVLWCPEDFPDSFVAEWELQNMETDAGLCIIFFAATGLNGEDIFDPSLQPRDGVFNKYTKGDLHNYHISYYANAKHNPGRATSHLRKNKGFDKVQIGAPGIPMQSQKIHKIQLVKDKNRIVMHVDDRKIIDWTDDGKEYGPPLKWGKIGFRQMQWTHFRYRNFNVWELEETVSQAWQRHTIDASSSGADGVKLADFNGDGRKDIATGWEEGGITKLYLHPGPEQVKKEWPSVVVGKTPAVEDAVFLDMNGDDLLEIISCTEKGSEKIFVHWANNRRPLRSDDWKQEVLSASNNLMMWMYAEPLQIDGRGGIDLVAAGKGPGAQLGWFEAPLSGSTLSDWKWHAITPVGWVMSILFRDMDGDGDEDIIITDRKGELRGCRWLENPGPNNLNQVEWENLFLGSEGLEVMFMCIADLDGDGIEEAIVPECTEQTVRIYRRVAGSGSQWKEDLIQLPPNTGKAKSVAAGDLNQDGYLDLIVSTETTKLERNGLIWLDGKKIGEANLFDFQTVSGIHPAKYDRVELWDIDEDGDLDILTCEENYGLESEGLGVIWYENEH